MSRHTKEIYDIAISKKYIVSCSDDKSINIWNITHRKVIKTFKGHDQRICSLIICLNDKYIISGSFEKMIMIWRFDSG